MNLLTQLSPVDLPPALQPTHDGIATGLLALSHGIELSVRAAGPWGNEAAPVAVLLHGFPQAAFVWDDALSHLASLGVRAVAPNLRGYERSSAPADVSAYRAKHLVQDTAALMNLLSPNQPIAALVAHDWGGAVAWNLANQLPQRMQRLGIVNSPHPGTFLRELKSNPAQQAASQYMNLLALPNAADMLSANHHELMWQFMNGTAQNHQNPALGEKTKAQHQAVWAMGLQGGCNYYQASPLRPEPAVLNAIDLPASMLQVTVPTQVLWGLGDTALLPGLLDGLQTHVPDLKVTQVPNATHWIIQERPDLLRTWLTELLKP
jgi:epoxide hydrolase 4